MLPPPNDLPLCDHKYLCTYIEIYRDIGIPIVHDAFDTECRRIISTS